MLQRSGQKALAQLGGAVSVDHPRHHVVDGDVGGGRGAALRQFLEDERGIEPRQRRAADVGAHVDAAEAERGGPAKRLDREDLVLVPLAGKRHHLVAREGAGGVLDGALFLGEVEVHAATGAVSAVEDRPKSQKSPVTFNGSAPGNQSVIAASSAGRGSLQFSRTSTTAGSQSACFRSGQARP